MNEGYRLTDFTLEELSALSSAITFKMYTDISHEEKERYHEIYVRVLTAFSIVKEREKVTIN